MIIGRKQIQQSENKIWDYLGVLYPEGYLGDNYKFLTYYDLINNYNLYVSLNKNDLVKVITNDDRESIAYVVGFTSGMFEVKSKIGDGYDIISNKFNPNNIFGKQRSQFYITVSTIKEIKKLSISVLGEISGL